MKYTEDEKKYGVEVYSGRDAYEVGYYLSDHDVPNLAGGNEAEGYTVRVLPEYVSRAREALCNRPAASEG